MRQTRAAKAVRHMLSMMTHGSVLSMLSMLPFHAVLLSARVAAVVLLCVVCQIARVPAPRPTARRPARLQRPKQSAPLRSARLRLAVQRPTAIGLLYALSANKADSLRATGRHHAAAVQRATCRGGRSCDMICVALWQTAPRSGRHATSHMQCTAYTGTRIEAATGDYVGWA